MQKNNENKIIKQIQPNVQNEVLIDNFDSDAKIITTRMWANAQLDGRPAEHRWRPLFNAPKFG